MSAAAEDAGEELVRLSGASVRLGGRAVLEDVDLAIAPGEIVTVVGPNGSGKTTLLRTVLGAVKPGRGQVTRAPGLRLGYVPQALVVDPTLPMTVSRFLALPGRMGREADGVTASGTVDALRRAGAPGLGDRQLADLSGGQRQRVLLARALRADPQLLVLDEPTAGLDQPGASAFYRQIEALRDATGCAVLMVSHDLHVVMSASDRVICLNCHVCCEGRPEAVASAPAYRALFGAGTGGALALYRHDHDHGHDHHHGHDHAHAHREAAR